MKGRVTEEQRKTLAYIDAILLLLEKYIAFENGGNFSGIINPFDYLLGIIRKTAKFEDIVEWLVNMLVKTLPAIELGVKAVILSNLKATIDCNNDPRIPYKFRLLPPFSSLGSNINDAAKGIEINLRSIDYKNILSVSPLSEYGQNYYFGTNVGYEIQCLDEKLNGTRFTTYRKAKKFIEKEGLTTKNIVEVSEINNVFELCRAEDFNAFLWFVAHKAYFGEGKSSDKVSGYIPFQPFTSSGKLEDGCIPYSVGDIITGTSTLHICTKVKVDYKGNYDAQGKPYEEEALKKGDANSTWEADFIPFAPRKSSTDNTPRGVNWYVNKNSFYDFLLSPKDREPRDYSKEVPICNVQYIGSKERLGESTSVKRDNVLINVLPKPFIHIPQVKVSAETDPSFKIDVYGEAPWHVQRILFNEKGEPDPKGKYSVWPTSKGTYSDNVCEYRLNNGRLIVQKGKYVLDGDISQNLFECYPGLTVYEFNYDYVMGIKLLDPEVVFKQLMELVMNVKVGPMHFNVNKTETAYQMRVSEIVENILNSTTEESSDCFFSFSNSKFEEMLQKAELKRSQGYSFTDSQNNVTPIDTSEVLEILSEFKNDATLEENKDVMTRAIKSVTAKITDEVLPEDKYNVEMGFISDCIKALTNTIVETLLSPKMVILFEMNKQLMAKEPSKPLSIEKFIESMQGLLVAIVNEIRDLILRELLAWAMKILQDITSKVATLLANEQAHYYAMIMMSLLRFMSRINLKGKHLDTQLDDVYYADIDPIDQPKIETC